MRQIRWIIALFVVLATFACTDDPGTPAQKADVCPAIFPDYVDVSIPQNIAPMNFGIKGARSIKVIFSLEGNEMLTVCGKDHVEIDEKAWHKLLDAAKGKSLDVAVGVWDLAHPDGIAYRSFQMHVKDEIDPWIVYRLIDPGYDSWGHIGIYQRNLSNFDEQVLISNEDNRARCVNCHSFADYNPETMMYHQRSVDPATVIIHDGVEGRVNLKEIGIKKQGLYCKWHPSGKYIIFSNNGTHQSFLDRGKKVLEVYDTHSSLFLYDVKAKDTKAVVTPDSSSEGSMQTFATWAADGKWLYYCSAPQQKEFPADYEKVKYSIVRIGFDEATGLFANQTDTIYNARVEGKSASFPRISPDNRYLLFTEADCGTFPVYHPEAALQIIDLKDNKRIDAGILNSNQSESYNAWSSSGRWMMFQSRRMDGRHTRLMLAYFGKDGKPGKPFMLPQRDPEDNRTRIWSYNVPEFVKGSAFPSLTLKGAGPD